MRDIAHATAHVVHRMWQFFFLRYFVTYVRIAHVSPYMRPAASMCATQRAAWCMKRRDGAFPLVIWFIYGYDVTQSCVWHECTGEPSVRLPDNELEVTRTHIHTRTRTHTHTHKTTCARAHTHTHTHTYTHMHPRTYTHIHINIHTYAHTCSLSRSHTRTHPENW